MVISCTVMTDRVVIGVEASEPTIVAFPCLLFVAGLVFVTCLGCNGSGSGDAKKPRCPFRKFLAS